MTSRTWTHCPECNTGPGGEHTPACSYWNKSKYYKDMWNPVVNYPENLNERIRSDQGT